MTSPRFSIAPMLDWTDRHCRYLHRLLSQHALLFTEMIVAHACLKGNTEKLLQYAPQEHPVALQLGGNDPHLLAEATRIAVDFGYDEVNLNVGCPSDRVQSGCFGLQLFLDPARVAACVEAMQKAAGSVVPVTVKTRLGVDHVDTYEALVNFVNHLVDAGCQRLYIHARKGWLKGLSPKENRTIPPLDYDRVYQLKQDFPALHIGLNGGVETLQDALMHLSHVDSVMMGRAAYHDPYLLRDVDHLFYGDAHSVPTREEVIESYIRYAEVELSQGVPLTVLIKPLFGLYQSCSGAQRFRRYLSEHGHLKGVGVDVIRAAIAARGMGVGLGSV